VLTGVLAIAFAHQESFHRAFATIAGFLNAVVIAIPVLMLAVKAFENGLRPEREIDRYETYRAGIEAVRREYDDSRTSQSTKRALMFRLEQLAFLEMRDFLRVNDKATFVL
jgi:hypothetical protein